MQASKIDQFRQTLASLAQRLGEDVSELTRETESSTSATDINPRGQNEFDPNAYQEGMTLLENEQKIRDEIGAAIERLDQGTFGVCESCGHEIAIDRLEAIPYARRCKACAEK